MGDSQLPKREDAIVVSVDLALNRSAFIVQRCINGIPVLDAEGVSGIVGLAELADCATWEDKTTALLEHIVNACIGKHYDGEASLHILVEGLVHTALKGGNNKHLLQGRGSLLYSLKQVLKSAYGDKISIIESPVFLAKQLSAGAGNSTKLQVFDAVLTYIEDRTNVLFSHVKYSKSKGFIKTDTVISLKELLNSPHNLPKNKEAKNPQRFDISDALSIHNVNLKLLSGSLVGAKVSNVFA